VGLLVDHLVEDGRVAFVDDPGEAGQGVSMQDGQGDDITSGSRAALRSGVPSFETWSAVPPSRDVTF
jgi:hypothetical protein